MTRAGILAALALCAATAGAQGVGVRVNGTTMARYIELRPMVVDSVDADSTTAIEGTLRATPAGVPVRCMPGEIFCRYLRTGDDRVGGMPLLQDLEINAWGFGEGIRGYVQLRGRAALNDAEAFWPQADDRFDALAAFIEMERERYRIRAGRQWATSALGYYNYDGASVGVSAHDRLDVEIFGGWSLARGTHEAHDAAALRSIEAIAPDERAYLMGLELQARPFAQAAVAARYQRELRTDRGAMYSDRAAFDATYRIGRLGRIEGEATLDFGASEFNELRLRGQAPVWGGVLLDAQVRRYRPFFEYWTIWGAFSPVAYVEGSLGAFRGFLDERVTVALRGARRSYLETEAGTDFIPMKDNGWRVGTDIGWTMSPGLTASGSYQTEVGFGAARTDASLGARWTWADRVYIGAMLSTFQTAYEFRVGTGRVNGMSLEGGFDLRSDIRVVGDVSVFSHDYGDRAPATDWTQRRGSLRLEWSVGADPGMSDRNGDRR